MSQKAVHAELSYRTLLVHAQYVNKTMGGGNIEEVAVDLLSGLMHLSQEYGADFDELLHMAKVRFETESTEIVEAWTKEDSMAVKSQGKKLKRSPSPGM